MNELDSKIQDQFDAFEAHVMDLEAFLDDLLVICKKHDINNAELKFVNGLFEKGYLAELEVD